MGVAALEEIQDRPFVVRYRGGQATLPDPRTLPHAQIMRHLETGGGSLVPVWRMPSWKAEALLSRWLAHHGLGDPRTVARLNYLIDRYEERIAYDLQRFAGVDLETEWRSRRYRRLLQIIDHLPSYSYFQDAVANDPEHAKMLAEAAAERQEGEEHPGPSLTSWTPEVAILADVVDELRAVRHSIIMSNHDPKKTPPSPPKPYRRPSTALSRLAAQARHESRQKKHQSLAERLLPHKNAK